jgi:hypothetical protein
METTFRFSPNSFRVFCCISSISLFAFLDDELPHEEVFHAVVALEPLLEIRFDPDQFGSGLGRKLVQKFGEDDEIRRRD